jgi:hypothetical protein
MKTHASQYWDELFIPMVWKDFYFYFFSILASMGFITHALVWWFRIWFKIGWKILFLSLIVRLSNYIQPACISFTLFWH